MEDPCSSYIKQVERALDLPRHRRKELLQGLRAELKEKFPKASSTEELQIGLGRPEEVASALRDAVDSKEYLRFRTCIHKEIRQWYNRGMEEKRRKWYPSDLTDKEWEEIAPLYEGMRNCTWSKRELTDAVLYLVDSGCKWRQLPHDFPPYSTVHSFYRRARISGLWDKILEHLVKKTRTNAGRKESPSYAIIDSQSVKTVAASEERGIDGGKKRKAGSGTS